MKRILCLLISLCSLAAMAQQYPVSSINITLPPQPAPNIGDWSMPFLIAAQARLVNGQVPGNLIESRILVTIKKNGSRFCGNYTPQNAPMSVFNSPTKTWSGGVAINLVSTNCEMPAGTYELCVQFFTSSLPAMPLSNEVCKSFIIQDRNNNPTNYTPPQNIQPFDGKQFTAQEAGLPIPFRWTPVMPKPKGDILYKVRLFEIMPGQSKIQALGNAPIEEKEVRNETQTTFRLGKRSNGIVWVVEAVGAEVITGGPVPIPKNYGKSEATQFGIAVEEKGQTFSPPQNVTPEDGKIFPTPKIYQPILFRWTPVVPKPKVDVLYKVKVFEVPKGASKAETIRSGIPVETVESRNITQAPLKLSKRCNGCEYVWNVEASKRSQLGDVEMLGTSEATGFEYAKEEKGQDTTRKNHVISLIQPADGTVITPSDARKPTGFVFSVNTVPAPEEGIGYILKIWEVPPGKTAAQVIQSGQSPIYVQDKKQWCCREIKMALPPNSEGKHFAWTVVEVKENPVAGEEVKQGKLLFNEFSVGKGTTGRTNPGPNTIQSQCDVNSRLETYKCLGKDANGNLVYSVTTNFIVNSTTTGAVVHFNDLNNTSAPYCTSNGPLAASKGNPCFFEVNGTGMNKVTTQNDMNAASGPFKATYSNGSYTTTYKITIPAGTTQIIVGYYFYTTPDNATCVPKDTINIDAPCPCDLCETLSWGESGGNAALGQDKNVAQIYQSFSMPDIKIKQVTAEIIGFDWQVNEDCKRCLKETYGYFTGGTANGEHIPNKEATFPIVDGTPLVNSFELQWNLCGNTKPQPLNGIFNMDITLPPYTSLSCCTDQFNICIRYTIVTDDCRTCSKVICYPLSRKNGDGK